VRYIIIGAGAVGGTIGGCLALAGHEVVLTARGAHLDALRRHGLRLSTPSGTDTVAAPALGGPAELDLRPGDVLVVATKACSGSAATRPGPMRRSSGSRPTWRTAGSSRR
jgi:2-dehydropantoate 2-reductase